MTSAHSNKPAPVQAAPMYRAGTAARLSGIPVETLRVWERRYGLLRPRRSASGHREYSAEEVSHLTLIKQLVDRGNPIGAIAHLSPVELAAMLEELRLLSEHASNTQADQSYSNGIKLAIVAERMSNCLFEIDRYEGRFEVARHCTNLQGARTAFAALSADLLLIEASEIANLAREEVEEARKLINARGVIIMYRFARHDVISKLRLAGYLVARTPSDASELASLCELLMSQNAKPAPDVGLKKDVADTTPATYFDDQALTAITLAANSVYCECPRHLVEILHMLGSFERYSAQCQNENPKDEILHRQIHQATAQARVIIEGALKKVALAEGLPLPRQ